MENMRQVELQNAAKENKQAQTPQITQTKDKNTERQIQNLERKIEKMEAEISEIEVKMSEDGFYQSEHADSLIQQHNQKKEQLEELMIRWEELYN